MKQWKSGAETRENTEKELAVNTHNFKRRVEKKKKKIPVYSYHSITGLYGSYIYIYIHIKKNRITLLWKRETIGNGPFSKWLDFGASAKVQPQTQSFHCIFTVYLKWDEIILIMLNCAFTEMTDKKKNDSDNTVTVINKTSNYNNYTF